ncbi:hypothetical protein BJ742DRAFT_859746 [Cladochytrium replicatum]|nr:hypothetical protein BJ742DRAFT_859746 [Cladochytrium replicatum]
MQDQRHKTTNPRNPDNNQIPQPSIVPVQNLIRAGMDESMRARLEFISRMEEQLEEDRQRLIQQLDGRLQNAHHQPDAVDSAIRVSLPDVTYSIPHTSLPNYESQHDNVATAGSYPMSLARGVGAQLLANQPVPSTYLTGVPSTAKPGGVYLTRDTNMETPMTSNRRTLPPTLDFAGMVESLGMDPSSFLNTPPHLVQNTTATSTSMFNPALHTSTAPLTTTSFSGPSKTPLQFGDQNSSFDTSTIQLGSLDGRFNPPSFMQPHEVAHENVGKTIGSFNMGAQATTGSSAPGTTLSQTTNAALRWQPGLSSLAQPVGYNSHNPLHVSSRTEFPPLLNVSSFPAGRPEFVPSKSGGFPIHQSNILTSLTSSGTITQSFSQSSDYDPRKKLRRKRENSNQLGTDTNEVVELGCDTRVQLGSGLRMGPSYLDNLPRLPPESKLNNLLQLFLTGEGSSLVPIFNSRHFSKLKLPPFVLLALQTLAARFTGDRDDVSLGSNVLLVRAQQEMLPILMESAHRTRDGWSTTDSSRSSSSGSPEGSTIDPKNPSVVTRRRSQSEFGYPAELFALSGMVHVLYYLSMSSDPAERTMGKNWLALAVVTARGLGLNNEPPDESSVSWTELSMRRRIWWGLWTIDNISPLRNRANNCLASMKESNVRVLTDDSFWLMTPTEDRPPEDRMPPFMSDVHMIFEAHGQYDGEESNERGDGSSDDDGGTPRKDSKWNKTLIKRPFLDDSSDGLEVPGLPVDASEPFLNSVLYGCQRKIYSLSKRRQVPFAAIAQKLTIARPYNVRIGIVVTVLENSEEMSRQNSNLRLEPWLPIFNKKWSLLGRRRTKSEFRGRASTADSVASEIVPYSGNPEDYLRRAPTQNPQIMHQAFIFKNKKAAEFMRKQRNLLRLFRMVDAQFHVVGDGSAATGGRQFGLFRLIHYHHAWVILHTPIMIVEQFVRFVTGLPTQEPDDPPAEPRSPKLFPESDYGILARWASSDYGGVLSSRHALRISEILGEMWGERQSESALSLGHPSRGSGTPYVDQTSGFLGVLCLYFYICGCVLVVCHGFFNQHGWADLMMVDRGEDAEGTVGRRSREVRDGVRVILRVLRGISKNWAICNIYSDSLQALMDGAEKRRR